MHTKNKHQKFGFMNSNVRLNTNSKRCKNWELKTLYKIEPNQKLHYSKDLF